MRWGRIGLCVALSLLPVVSSGPARALTDEEIFRDFRFNFTNPGARSLGLGGAFIAAADDATAAQANPAALHYVSQSEFFIEYRAVQPETQTFNGQVGDISDPTSMTFPFLSVQVVTNREDTTLPSFTSYAVPFRIGSQRARLAVSRQVVLDVLSSLRDDEVGSTSQRYSTDTFPIWVNNGALSCREDQAGTLEQYSICNSVSGSLDTELIHYNVAFAWSFLPDFSVGLTGTYATLDMVSELTNTTEDPRGVLISANPRIDTGGGNLSDITSRTTINDSDAAVTYTMGLHWHPDRAFPKGISPVRFGLVYRKGAELRVREEKSIFDPNFQQFVPDTAEPFFENTLREPDRYGLGASFEWADHWTFALDVERIQYSDLKKEYRAGENFLTSDTIQGASLGFTVDNFSFDVDDATVVHGGIEFYSRSRGGWRYALRGGYYNAPDNRIRLTDLDVTAGSPSEAAQIETAYKDAFRGGEDFDHLTLGLSLNTPGGFQIQLAGDLADSGDEFLASAIFRFGAQR